MKSKGNYMKLAKTIDKNKLHTGNLQTNELKEDMQAKHAEIQHKIEIASEAFDCYQETIMVKTPIWSELY